MFNRLHGQIDFCAHDFVPQGCLPCDGSLIERSKNQPLFDLLGHRYGGSGEHFALPDLKGKTPPGTLAVLVVDGSYPNGHAIAAKTGFVPGRVKLLPYDFTPIGWTPCRGQALANVEHPFLHAAIGERFGSDRAGTFKLPALDGLAPPDLGYFIYSAERSPSSSSSMSATGSAIGLIELFASLTLPEGWLPCDGRQLPIGEHTQTFSLLRDRFGGDGYQTFALPDFRNIAPSGLRFGFCLDGFHPTRTG